MKFMEQNILTSLVESKNPNSISNVYNNIMYSNTVFYKNF
jgi:hypothetical protein